ncbi:30S ribosomal protein 2, chloroplastic, partial [Mucuna pruriens]
MNSKRRRFNKMKSSTQIKTHKLYAGNLAKTVRPEQLRDLFSRFGSVVSARVLHDYKHRKGRIYALLSFQSEADRDAAMSINGTEFCGWRLIIKMGVWKTEP